MGERLDVQAVLEASPPPGRTVDFGKLTMDQVLQLRTGIAALWLSAKSAQESLRQAMQVEKGETQIALLTDVQAACFRNRQAMKVIMEIIG